ncbi:hypothetical protein VCHA52P454_70021 [Vibrio chagasii]|nr:hypothetical protein VCHA29O37_280045 [Vibrio chagasii]CAH7383850.1 hypothetical protein VCHA52P454_70021 [Vibrio chagasii]
MAISTVYAFVSMAVESLRDGLLGKQRRNRSAQFDYLNLLSFIF